MPADLLLQAAPVPTPSLSFDLLHLGVALGIGVLIGTERERSKALTQNESGAGLRSFVLAALAGALSTWSGEPLLLPVTVLALALIGTVPILRAQTVADPTTTALALIVTGLLGGLAQQSPAWAAGLGVGVTGLLFERDSLHRFVDQVLTQQEIRDGLLLLAVALIVLPLTPDRNLGPYHLLNPHALLTVALLMMSVNAAGYIALRAFGVRYGLPLAGFFAGFVSSTAATMAMGERARQTRAAAGGAVAGASLASIASTIQVGIIVEALSQAVLVKLLLPLLAAIISGGAWASFCLWTATHSAATAQSTPGRPFRLRTALLFAATIGSVMLLSAFLQSQLGNAGAIVSALFAGLADAHSAAAASCALVVANRLDAGTGVTAILLGYTSNWLVKLGLAFSADRAYGWRMLPGLLLMPAAAWAVLLLS